MTHCRDPRVGERAGNGEGSRSLLRELQIEALGHGGTSRQQVVCDGTLQLCILKGEFFLRQIENSGEATNAKRSGSERDMWEDSVMRVELERALGGIGNIGGRRT